MKRIGFFVFFFLSSFLWCAAQTHHDWWYTLERGKRMFRQGDYGSALLTFEDARRQRQAMYERMERHFINVLSLSEVRTLGDSLEWVERYIQERHYSDAAEALAELYYRIPKEQFNQSVSAALSALGSLKDYPEAEYWIGETFLIEGELRLAQNQFQKTLALRAIFENPGLATELLYKIAAICQTRQDYNEMERTLHTILESDGLWSSGRDGETLPGQASVSFAKQAMTRTLETNGINRFLTLYRYHHTESVSAHRLLGFYYYASGRHSRAQEHLMFAFLIQNTIIIDEVIRRQYDFSYTTLEALADIIQNDPFLADYAEKNEYYKTAYYLGASLYGNGKASSARDIWNFLAAQNRIGEWQARAITQLNAPSVERAVEMP